eukprot:PhM_4_TR11664/c1_g1_i2/m.64182
MCSSSAVPSSRKNRAGRGQIVVVGLLLLRLRLVQARGRVPHQRAAVAAFHKGRVPAATKGGTPKRTVVVAVCNAAGEGVLLVVLLLLLIAIAVVIVYRDERQESMITGRELHLLRRWGHGICRTARTCHRRWAVDPAALKLVDRQLVDVRHRQQRRSHRIVDVTVVVVVIVIRLLTRRGTDHVHEGAQVPADAPALREEVVAVEHASSAAAACCEVAAALCPQNVLRRELPALRCARRRVVHADLRARVEVRQALVLRVEVVDVHNVRVDNVLCVDVHEDALAAGLARLAPVVEVRRAEEEALLLLLLLL